MRRYAIAVLLGQLITLIAVSTTQAAQTIAVAPVADATILAKSDRTNFGSATLLQTDSAPVEEFLIKFLLTGVGSGRVTQATLRLFTVNGSDRGGDFYLTSEGWDERTVTYRTAPPVTSGIVASLGSVSAGTWVSVDVSSVVRGDGAYSFRVRTTSNDGADYESREASRKPQLLVVIEPPASTEPLIVSAGADQTAAEGSPVTFVATATGGTPPYTFAWALGDGTSQSGSSVTRAYADNGTFTATVTATDAAGRSASDGAVVTVSNVPPAVTSSAVKGTAGSPTSFTANVSDPGAADRAAGFTLLWDFGDGGTASGPSVSHTYTAAGTYTVVVTAKDKDGGIGTGTTSATIATPSSTETLTFLPAADATIKAGSPRTNYGTAAALEVDGSPIEQALMKFDVTGLGGRPIQRVVLRLHCVNTSDRGGDFYPALTSAWAEGTVTWDTAPAADATAVASLGPVEAGQSYEVDLSGYITAEGTYSLRLTSLSGDGADYASKEASNAAQRPQLLVTVLNAPPGPLSAQAGADHVSSEGTNLKITGSASGGSAPYHFTWDFGDASTATGASTMHAYADNGTFTMTVTVRDSAAPPATATDTATATIMNVAPTAKAGGPYSGPVGAVIEFAGSATDPSPADTEAPFRFVWDFGDGTTGEGAAPRKAFAAAGSYKVQLTVTDKDGGSGTAATTATIGDTPAPPPPPPGGTAVLAATGDFGASANTDAVLQKVPEVGAQTLLALGDLSYGKIRPETAWCDYVRGHVGATVPVELVAGNHDDDSEPAGQLIYEFVKCLPHDAGAIGDYGKQYYVDWKGLARIIMISPDLQLDGTFWTYEPGSPRYIWVAQAIDGARAAGIPWVIVGMHKTCISVGEKDCDIGAGLFNLFLEKRVDLILHAHDHNYQRSKQLAHSPICAAIVPGSFNAGCVADDGADGHYVRGAGPVVVIVGTGGIGGMAGLYPVNASDSEAGYFAIANGANSSSPTWGLLKLTVDATTIAGEFVPAIGTFTDAFRIGPPATSLRPIEEASTIQAL